MFAFRRQHQYNERIEFERFFSNIGSVQQRTDRSKRLTYARGKAKRSP
jgi:hypothetical protein